MCLILTKTITLMKVDKPWGKSSSWMTCYDDSNRNRWATLYRLWEKDPVHPLSWASKSHSDVSSIATQRWACWSCSFSWAGDIVTVQGRPQHTLFCIHRDEPPFFSSQHSDSWNITKSMTLKLKSLSCKKGTMVSPFYTYCIHTSLQKA